MLRQLLIGSRGRSANGNARAGQALAEFVLVVPALLLLVFGIIEFGLAFRTYQIVTNTAREGARAAVLPSDNDDATIEQVVRDRLAASGLDPDQAEISFSCDGVEGGLCTASRTGRESGVIVSYPYRFLVLGPLMAATCGANCGDRFGEIFLEATSVMRNE